MHVPQRETARSDLAKSRSGLWPIGSPWHAFGQVCSWPIRSRPCVHFCPLSHGLRRDWSPCRPYGVRRRPAPRTRLIPAAVATSAERAQHASCITSFAFALAEAFRCTPLDEFHACGVEFLRARASEMGAVVFGLLRTPQPCPAQHGRSTRTESFGAHARSRPYRNPACVPGGQARGRASG